MATAQNSSPGGIDFSLQDVRGIISDGVLSQKIILLWIRFEFEDREKASGQQNMPTGMEWMERVYFPFTDREVFSVEEFFVICTMVVNGERMELAVWKAFVGIVGFHEKTISKRQNANTWHKRMKNEKKKSSQTQTNIVIIGLIWVAIISEPFFVLENVWTYLTHTSFFFAF